MNVRLQSVTLIGGASAIGHTLSDIDLPAQCGAEVAMLRRGKQRLESPQDIELMAGDIVVLRGSSEAILRAEKRLLSK